MPKPSIFEGLSCPVTALLFYFSQVYCCRYEVVLATKVLDRIFGGSGQIAVMRVFRITANCKGVD